MNILGIKLCPFCKAEAELGVYGCEFGSKTYYGISCTKCKIASTGNDCHSVKEAVSKWNTRDGEKYDALMLTIMKGDMFFAEVATDKAKLKFHKTSRKLPEPNEEVFIFNKDMSEHKSTRLVEVRGFLHLNCWAKEGKITVKGPIGYDLDDYPLWIKKEDIPEMKLLGQVKPSFGFQTMDIN